MTNKNFIEELADKLNKRTNPTDLKSNIIGKVVQLNPIIVQIADGRILFERRRRVGTLRMVSIPL